MGYCFIGVGVGFGFYSGSGYNKQVFLLVKLNLKFLRLSLWCYTEYFGPALYLSIWICLPVAYGMVIFLFMLKCLSGELLEQRVWGLIAFYLHDLQEANNFARGSFGANLVL